MKGIYWRPQRVSREGLAVIAVLALLGMLAVETLRVTIPTREQAVKVRAARQAAAAFARLADAREAAGYPIDRSYDPWASGMIGLPNSPITSTRGHLPAKQRSTDPNLAAMVVDLLLDADVRPGDTIAVGMSGSFPAMNVATLVAAEALGVRTTTVTSCAASEWGANIIDFGWLDMEDVLVDGGLLRTRSLAATLGGIDDRATEMTAVSRSLLRAQAERHGVPLLDATTLAEAIDERMAVYDAEAGPRAVAAYVNVGGGSASVGGPDGRVVFEPGVNLPGRVSVGDGVDAVMVRFLERGVPVIHVSGIRELVARYGLPPDLPPERPRVGEGPLFEVSARDPRVAVLVGLIVLLALFALTRASLRVDLGSGHAADGPPRPMV